MTTTPLPTRLLDLVDVVERRGRLVRTIIVGVGLLAVLVAFVAPGLLPPRPEVGAAVGLLAILVAVGLAAAFDASDEVLRSTRHVRDSGAELVGVVASQPSPDAAAPLAEAILTARTDTRVTVGLAASSRGADVAAWTEALALALARTGVSVLAVDLAGGASPHDGVLEVVRGGVPLGRAVDFETDVKLARLGAGRDLDAALGAAASFPGRLPKDLEVLLVALPPVAGKGILDIVAALDTTLLLARANVTPKVRLAADVAGLEAARTLAQVVLVDDRLAARSGPAPDAEVEDEDEDDGAASHDAVGDEVDGTDRPPAADGADADADDEAGADADGPDRATRDDAAGAVARAEPDGSEADGSLEREGADEDAHPVDAAETAEVVAGAGLDDLDSADSADTVPGPARDSGHDAAVSPADARDEEAAAHDARGDDVRDGEGRDGGAGDQEARGPGGADGGRATPYAPVVAPAVDLSRSPSPSVRVVRGVEPSPRRRLVEEPDPSVVARERRAAARTEPDPDGTGEPLLDEHDLDADLDPAAGTITEVDDEAATAPLTSRDLPPEAVAELASAVAPVVPPQAPGSGPTSDPYLDGPAVAADAAADDGPTTDAAAQDPDHVDPVDVASDPASTADPAPTDDGDEGTPDDATVAGVRDPQLLAGAAAARTATRIAARPDAVAEAPDDLDAADDTLDDVADADPAAEVVDDDAQPDAEPDAVDATDVVGDPDEETVDPTDEIPAVRVARLDREAAAADEESLRTTAQLALLLDELGERDEAPTPPAGADPVTAAAEDSGSVTTAAGQDHGSAEEADDAPSDDVPDDARP